MHLIKQVHEIVKTNKPMRVAEHGFDVNVKTARFILASYVTTPDYEKLAFRLKLHNARTFRDAVHDLRTVYNKKKTRRVLIDNIIGDMNGVQ